MSERAQTTQANAAEVERDRRRDPAGPVPEIGPATGVGRIAALQRSAGNRAVQRLVQRHPGHAPEEEEIQRAPAPEVQRHPEHAPEEEEIQRAPVQGVQRLTVGGKRIWESKKAKRKRMEKEYGTPFTGDLPKAMLDRLDKILSKLPRSHTAGNASLKAITGGGGIGKNTSAYDSSSEEIEMNVPEMAPGIKMPWWVYLLLTKGNKWMRGEMDKGAMSDFNIDTAKDAELGLTGKREVMAGVSDVLAQERLVDWTVRHEMGHSVDQQIKFMPTRGRLAVFGGWQMHAGMQTAEVAKAFLQKAGFGDTEIAKKVSPTKTLLERADDCIQPGSGPRKLVLHVDAIAKALQVKASDLKSMLEEFDESAAVASAHPWTFADGGGTRITHNGRTYHIDHYGTWISYLAAARSDALSNYQFSSPGEWFAESYAAFYDPRKNSSARNRMPPEAREWFNTNLGPPSTSRAGGRQSTGKLADDQGQLGSLKDLDDAVATALNDSTRTVTVKKSDLPEDLADLFG